MTFWANNLLYPDIAGLLMSRGVVAHWIWPGHQSAFTFITRSAPQPALSSTHVQLHFSANTLLLLVISFCEKDLQKKINLYFMWKGFQIKNNQKEHLSLIHRGPNTVFNVTKFLQKRGVSINILTPPIWKLSILVINVGNNLLN